MTMSLKIGNKTVQIPSYLIEPGTFVETMSQQAKETKTVDERQGMKGGVVEFSP